MTRVVLADDHQVVRLGLKALLSSEPDLTIVGEAADGLAVVSMVEHLRPDILVLDLMMPGLNGLEVTRRVRQRSPGTRVIILSMYANDSYVLEALQCGATGYVLKDCSATDLTRAIRDALGGRRFLSAPLSDHIINDYLNRNEVRASDAYDWLTPREKEVLHLVAEGYNNAEIAARLSLSVRTVETHRGNFMRKLSLHNQTDVVAYAISRGIIAHPG